MAEYKFQTNLKQKKNSYKATLNKLTRFCKWSTKLEIVRLLNVVYSSLLKIYADSELVSFLHCIDSPIVVAHFTCFVSSIRMIQLSSSFFYGIHVYSAVLNCPKCTLDYSDLISLNLSADSINWNSTVHCSVVEWWKLMMGQKYEYIFCSQFQVQPTKCSSSLLLGLLLL